MSIVYRATSGNLLYFWGLVSIFVFIGYAAVQVAIRITDERAVASASAPTKSTTYTATPPTSIYVIDGDTISLNDGRPNVRLIGFNAPETGSRARCEIERQRGEAAKQRLRELVSKGRPEFHQVACSCPPGTEGTNACNFGRRCGTLRVNGVDVGSILVGEGLAVRFACGTTSCPTLPRPWC
jgi:endonuclease YncB( thermonuclease family)